MARFKDRKTTSLSKDVKNILTRVRGIVDSMKGVTYEKMADAAHEILERSNELAPEDTGALINSSKVLVDDKGSKTTFTIKYNADGSAPHALVQHEKPEPPGKESKKDWYVNHPGSEGARKKPGRPAKPDAGPKFLYRAFEEYRKKILMELKEQVADTVPKAAKTKDGKARKSSFLKKATSTIVAEERRG